MSKTRSIASVGSLHQCEYNNEVDLLSAYLDAGYSYSSILHLVIRSFMKLISAFGH